MAELQGLDALLQQRQIAGPAALLTVMSAQPEADVTSPDPLRPMSWLDWRQDGEEYIGGQYRIKLLAPHKWQVLLGGEHLRVHKRRAGAMDEAETHQPEGLRRRDMGVYGLIGLLALAAISLMVEFIPFNTLWSLLLFALLVYVGLTSLGRFTAAATRNRLDPYRRRAPWEPRGWWHR